MVKNRIRVSAPELVYSDDELKVTIDGSCCTLRRPDGKVNYWTTTGYTDKETGEERIVCYRYEGTTEQPFEKTLGFADLDYNGYKSKFPCGLWVQSFYRCDDGMLIGFTHREDFTRGEPDSPDYPQNYHLGFSVSHDDGKSWKYLGDVLGTICNYISKRRVNGKFPNVGGVPFFPGKDGYFYFYYNEYNEQYERYVSGARVPMKEAIEMIARGECPAALVKKYSGGDVWDTEAMYGVGACMFPMECADVKFVLECGYAYDCHADAAYCAALDKYIILLQSARQVIMFISDDGAHWSEHVIVANAEPDTGLMYYSTIVGLDDMASDDFSTVGKEFYVYYTHKVGFLRLPGNYGDYSTDMYYRVRVTIE